MQMRDPNETNASLQGGGLSPFRLWLIWVIWLPFAIPDIVGFFQSHPPLLRLIATLVAVALFFAVYIWATWRNVQRLVGAAAPTGLWQASPWLPIAVLVALSLTIVLLYKGIGTPFIFTSAYMAGRLPTVRAIQAGWGTPRATRVFGFALSHLLLSWVGGGHRRGRSILPVAIVW